MFSVWKGKMAVRHEILNNKPHISKVKQCPPLQSCGETDTSHILAGVQDGPSPMEKGVGISSQITSVFTLGPCHPMPRILLEVKEHLHEVIHSWVALLKINHDCQHTHNKNQLIYKCRS